MKSYKTYQECKIANPECEIVEITQKAINDFNEEHRFEPVVKSDEWESGYEFLDGNSSPRVADGYWKICNPSDYCMTVKEFLDAGYRFEVGDLYINYRGRVCKVGEFGHSLGACNIIGNIAYSGAAYILRAAALGSRPLKQYAVLYKGGGYSFQSDKPIGDDIIACFDLSHSEEPLSGDFFNEKPRTKVEYVKVTDSIWHLESDFKAGHLFAFDGQDNYVQVETEGDFTISHSADNLFRRIETSMTEREAFIEEMSRYATPSILGKMFDAGCRFVN